GGFKTMLKKALTAFLLPFLFLLSPSDAESANPAAQRSTSNVQRPTLNSAQNQNEQTGTLQKMIVESGTATMQFDLNRLNGISTAPGGPVQVQFVVAADSFFPILVFNDLLRGAAPGSMALIPQNAPALPGALGPSINRLLVEKLPSGQATDLAVRDAKTGLTFFNIEGHQYDYDASGESLAINGGRLTLSRDFANALGRPSDAGAVVGKISIGVAMQPVEIKQLANGQVEGATMPPLRGAVEPQMPMATHGPDVIVGDLPDVEELGNAGTQVGLAIATTSCNNGDQPVDWFQLPNTDHTVVPQNFYRMSGGTDNTERFEQIGQSWLKHTFFALEDDACGFGCNTSGCGTGSHLCPGCSDPYSAGLNGDQDSIGSRAWVNPFTGSFPSNANDHSGHNHNGV